MYNINSDEWKRLGEEIDRRGGDGREVVKALLEHYSIYNEKILVWLGSLYDTDVGGFYYSKSGRLTDDERFLPDIESTEQACNFLCAAGLVSSFTDEIPKEMCDRMANFVCSLQSDEDGFVYHPQWGKNITTNRRGRDMVWARQMANRLKISLPYKTANERIAEATFGSETAKEKRSAMASFPEHLTSKAAFTEYLEGFDWTHGGYAPGNNVAAQMDQIVAAGLGECACDFLTQAQNKKSGLWGEDLCFANIDGAFKISYIYNGAKRLIPNAEKIVLAATECIARFEEETRHVCSLFNTWYTVINVIANIRRYGDAAMQREADMIISKLLLRAPSAIRATTKKISDFQKNDGSFSFYKHETSCYSQGALVAVPNPDGTQPDEGDINATVISSTSLTSNIYSALGLRDFSVKLYTPTDLKIFLDSIG